MHARTPEPRPGPRSRVDLDRLLDALAEEGLCAAKIRAFVHLSLLAICERGVTSPFGERPLDFDFVEGVLALADAMIDTAAVLDRTAVVQHMTRLSRWERDHPDGDTAPFDAIVRHNFDVKLAELTDQCDRLGHALRALRACPPAGVPLS